MSNVKQRTAVIFFNLIGNNLARLTGTRQICRRTKYHCYCSQQLQLLVLQQSQWPGKISKKQFWRSLINSVKNIDVLFPSASLCLHIFHRRQKGFSLGICDDGHKRVVCICIYIAAAPVRRSVIGMAFDGSVSVHELDIFYNSSFGYNKGTVSIISSSKANRIIAEFLPHV